jgi:hypothetical protein
VVWWIDREKEYASALSNDHCRVAIEVFSWYSDEFSPEEVEILKPVILLVLRALVAGSYEVMSYFDFSLSDHEYQHDAEWNAMQKTLESRRKPIYLRVWKGDEE